MKLLLIAAAMVGSAYGACIRATDVQLAAANIVGGEAVVAASAANAVGTCAAGWTGAGPTATDCASAGGVVTWTGCTTRWACTANVATTATSCASCVGEATRTSAATCLTCNGNAQLTAGACVACDCGTNGLTCSCAAGGGSVVITACDPGFAFTAIVAEIPAVTTAITAQAYIAADATKCPEVAGQALRAKVDIAAKIDAVAASCAATACSGEQAGCVTGTATNTVNTCSAAGSLKCTQSKRGFSFAAGEATACAKTNVATYKAPATDASGTCEAASCNAGWTISGTAPNQVCTTANACTAGAVKAGYAATGILVRAVAAAITRVCTSETTCAATPPTGTCTAGVDIVNIRAAVAASAATDVDGLGTVTCAEGFTGTAVAACPTADGAFTYTGCAAAAAAPASVAQTIVAFVLTVVAMYL